MLQRTLNKKQKIFLFILLFIFFSWFASLVFVKFLGFRINLTKSIPLGIYKLETNAQIKKDDYVEFCLDEKLSKIAYINGYINDGSCWGRYEALAKKIIAVPNDIVSVENNYIEVNGQKYNQYKQKLYSQSGNKANLIHYENKVIQGYFMVGDSDVINSWDSRYYGEIPKDNIRGVLIPKWTW